jgi:sulfite exporter TauE/SafE
MFPVLALVLYGFGWGLRRGASVCMALCVPAIIPRLAEGEGGWKSGARTALIYNAPRIAVLTALGACIGVAGFSARVWIDGLELDDPIWRIGYLLAGLLMAAYGIHAFARATDALEDIGEGRCADKPVHPLLSKLGFASPKTDGGLLIWGAIVSLACLGETAIALEGALAGYASGAESTSAAGGAVIGAVTFLAFALGASLPTLLVGAASSSALSEEKRERRLARIRQAAAAVMIVVGLLFLLTSAARLL